MTMTDTPLFEQDFSFPPQIVMNDDTARARLTNNAFSQRAADKSAETRSALEEAVLRLVRERKVLSGSRLNDLYHTIARDAHDPVQWPRVAWDSPRKRAGELAKKGALVVTNADAPRGTEAEYALPTEAREVAA